MAALPFAEDTLLARTLPGAEDADLQEVYDSLGLTVQKRLTEIQTVTLGVAADRLTAAAAEIAVHPLFEGVQKNYRYESEAAPNDPDYVFQSHLALIAAPQAWDVTTGDSELIIAVVDTGVESSHPDLAANLVEGWNLYDGNADFADVAGHGTSVAGSVAALSNNGVGVAGVVWGNPIMPIRIANPQGLASSGDLAAGIVWAVNHGAKVINVSFAPVASDTVILSAAQFAKNSGALVFISTGNNAKAFAASDNSYAIFVGAVSTATQLASFSNTGPYVDLVAPGTGIRTTAVGGGYRTVNGTSFASPLAAGVAALVWSANPDLSPAGVETVLMTTAHDLGNAGRDDQFGVGLIDAAAAVTAATNTTVTPDRTPPVVSIGSPRDQAAVSGSFSVSASAADDGGVRGVDLTVDGAPHASDATSPYRFTVNARKLSAGLHALSVRATDPAGNVSTPVTVQVRIDANSGSTSGPRDTAPPVIAFTSPAGGSVVVSAAAVRASVTDDVALRTVEWLVDGRRVLSGNLTGTRQTASFVWNASEASSGPHQIMIRVTDAAGNEASATLTLNKS